MYYFFDGVCIKFLCFVYCNVEVGLLLVVSIGKLGLSL